MKHTFSLQKYNDRYTLFIQVHNSPGMNDDFYSFNFDADEIQSLRDVLGVNNTFHIHEQNIQELGQRVNSLETQLMAQFEINQRLVRDVDKLEILVQGLYTHLRST